MDRVYKKLMERRKIWRDNIFFCEISTLNIEAYLELVICFFLQTDSQSYSWVAIILGIHAFVLIPALIIWISLQDQTTLESVKFQDRWGYFYQNFREKSLMSRLYYLLFAGKRIIFVSVCYFDFFKQRPWLALMVLIFMNLFSSIYNGTILPLKDKPENLNAMINELFFSGHLSLLICYTDYVTDPLRKIMAGWIHVFYLLCHIIFNLYFLVKE